MSITMGRIHGMYGYAIEGGAGGNGPCCTDLGLEVCDQDVGDEFMPERTGENRVDVVFCDRWLVFHVEGEKSRLDADIGDIIELGNDVVPVVGPGEAIGLVDLWAEVS
jgi:hypothetical protein